MKPTNGKILVRVDLTQKDSVKVGDSIFSTALIYESNFRYKSPTICEVVKGNKFVFPGDLLLIHHNLCYMPSPYHLQDDLFSIPFSQVLFAKIDSEGKLDPICGNVIVEEIPVETDIELPPEMCTLNKNAYRVLLPGWTTYKAREVILTRPSAGYQIVYHWNQEQRIAVKVDSQMICGVVKK